MTERRKRIGKGIGGNSGKDPVIKKGWIKRKKDRV